MGRGEPGGGKERDLRHKSEPSLREGGWGDSLISCVRFNEKRNKQDKTCKYYALPVPLRNHRCVGIWIHRSHRLVILKFVKSSIRGNCAWDIGWGTRSRRQIFSWMFGLLNRHNDLPNQWNADLSAWKHLTRGVGPAKRDLSPFQLHH